MKLVAPGYSNLIACVENIKSNSNVVLTGDHKIGADYSLGKLKARLAKT